MKAWILEKPGGDFAFKDVDAPIARAGGVVVEVKATPILSYLKPYIDGKMPYWYPERAFTPGPLRLCRHCVAKGAW